MYTPRRRRLAASASVLTRVAPLATALALTVLCLPAPMAQERHQPTFIKGKFAVPVSQDKVRKDWTVRGYSYPRVQPYPQGWSRGEHTHDVALIMTLLTGRMEFVFADQRFVVEPGDELAYPAHTTHAARNLYDGATQMLESLK